MPGTFASMGAVFALLDSFASHGVNPNLSTAILVAPTRLSRRPGRDFLLGLDAASYASMVRRTGPLLDRYVT